MKHLDYFYTQEDKDDGKEEGEEEEKDGGKGGEVLRDLRSSLFKRLLRLKRSSSGKYI